MKLLAADECQRLDGGYLVTINLQHLYECAENPSLRNAVFADARAHHCLDGRGAHVLFSRHAGAKPALAAGNEVLRGWLARSGGARVLLLGSDHEAVAALRLRFPDTQFVHDASEFRVSTPADAAATASWLQACYGSDFMFCAIALGVPKQELLAQALCTHLPSVPLLCIGGSIEMIAGRFKRAPAMLQALGLEGFWRLALQPTRARAARLLRSYTYFARLYLAGKTFRRLVMLPEERD